MTAAWDRFATHRAEGGFTLAELLVVIVLSTALGGIVVTAIVTGLHHERSLQDRNDALGQARTAIQRIDRDISSAQPLLSASNDELVLQEYDGTTTRVVTYSLVTSGATTQLVVDDSEDGVPAARKVLVTNLVDTADTPVFSYDSASQIVTVRLSVQPPSLNTPVTLSDDGTVLRNAT